MNDNDLDDRLREHGLSWREANRDRPGVDWDAVTKSSRGRLWTVVAGVAVAVVGAAVAIPIAFSSIGNHSAPSGQAVPSAKVAERGAPDGFFALSPPGPFSRLGGAAEFVYADGSGGNSTRPPHLHGVAMGVSSNGLVSYTAYPKSSCQTVLEKYAYLPHYRKVGEFRDSDVTTIPGTAGREAMAVSPDGTELAVVVDEGQSGGAGACANVNRIDVVNLQTHAVRVWSGSAHDAVSDLAWSPDGTQLSFELGQRCIECSGGNPDDLTYGAQLLSLASSGDHLDQASLQISAEKLTGEYENLAPVFWWKGHLSTIIGGSLRLLDGKGGLGAVERTGFPAQTLAVSSDPSGNHLLITAGPTVGFALGKTAIGLFNLEQNDITTGHLYRWDNGRLASVPGTWIHAGW